MNALFTFLAILTMGVLSPIIGMVREIKNPEAIFSTSAKTIVIRRLLISSVSITAMLLIARLHTGGWDSLGIPLTSEKPPEALKQLIIGMAMGGWLLFFIRIIEPYLVKEGTYERYLASDIASDISFAEAIKFTRFQDRAIRVAIYIIDVINEEIVFRGALVLLMRDLTGVLWPWILISISLSVIVHLYQGRSLGILLFHLLFAAYAVGVTVATGNIMMATGTHLFFNITLARGRWRFIDKKEQGELPRKMLPSARSSKNLLLFFIIALAGIVGIIGLLCLLAVGYLYSLKWF